LKWKALHDMFYGVEMIIWSKPKTSTFFPSHNRTTKNPPFLAPLTNHSTAQCLESCHVSDCSKVPRSYDDSMKSDDVLGLTLWKKISTMYCKMQFQNCILRSDYRALSGARRIRWRCYQTKMLPNRSDQGCTNLNKGPIYAIWN
jgi:hypothetical protein